MTSRNNSLLKTIRLISAGSHRAPKDLVVAEGIRVLEEVNKCNCRIETVLVSTGFGASGREESLLNAWTSRNIRVCSVEPGIFASVSDVRSPQGALALVRLPEFSLDSEKPSEGAMILFACGIQDPGNLGTLIRTSAAAGASMVCTSRGTVSARNPKAIRASAGAFFRMPVIEGEDISGFLRYCGQNRLRVFRTDVREGVPYTEADLGSACALLLGNEGGGIRPEEFLGIPALHIPMAEGVESLNVAAAGAILLFEASRQRGRAAQTLEP